MIFLAARSCYTLPTTSQEPRMTNQPNSLSRRNLLRTATGVTAASLLATTAVAADHEPLPDGNSQVAKNGHINHSVCLWCYKGMKSTDMAPVAKRLGLKAIDLLTPKDWGPLKENGLICSMT